MEKPDQATTVETVLFGILFLFFLQALSDFVEAIYAFGLLVTAFTVEIVSIVLFFTPLLLLLLRKKPSGSILKWLAVAAITARLLEPTLSPEGKLVSAGVSVGAFLVLFPLLIKNNSNVHGWQVGSGLTIAVALSIFLRTSNSSLDISESGGYQIIAWLLALVAGTALWKADLSPAEEDSQSGAASGGRVSGVAIGLVSVILMLYFAFCSPTVIARWTGYSYTAIIAVLSTTLVIFISVLSSDRITRCLTRRIILSCNALFVAALVLSILPHQISFPSATEAYPLDASIISPLATVPMYVMLLLSPVLLIDFILYARQISKEQPSIRQLGGSFALAALFFLVMVFFHVFTSIYDYIPVIGPLFRDRFWFVYLLAGLGLALPLLLVRGDTFDLSRPNVSTHLAPLMVGCLAISSIVFAFLRSPEPAVIPSAGPFKIMTYNIQQGFDQAGDSDLDGQLGVIRKAAPDILGLQESDTARIASGNVDAVRYFADSLRLYSYYGPTTTTGTFGIALLSRYPIHNANTLFLYSTGEQTAAIHAEIIVQGKTYQIFVTHLGNDGPIVQLENEMARERGLQNVIAMGDYNFPPTTEQYALMTRTLVDSWLLRWPGGKQISGFAADQRIDYIFVSPQIPVVQSEYTADPASDHPYLYSVIRP